MKSLRYLWFDIYSNIFIKYIHQKEEEEEEEEKEEWKVKVKSLSRARLLVTPWTAAYQAPPSMGFSRQEYWSGVPLPSPRYMLRDRKYNLGCSAMLFCPREWQIGIAALFLKQHYFKKNVRQKQRYSTGEYPANTNKKTIRALQVLKL